MTPTTPKTTVAVVAGSEGRTMNKASDDISAMTAFLRLIARIALF
jgi:hypothetical protein